MASHFVSVNNFGPSSLLLMGILDRIWGSLDFLFVYLFRATPAAFGDSQARGSVGALAPGLCQSHSNLGIQAMSASYTTAYGSTGSLTHWPRPGIEPTSSWLLVGFADC